jgi:PhnB protein
MKAPTALERTVAIKRVFDAPRERVFAAWTEARHLARWFGPAGFTAHSCEADPRPGGVFQLCMRAPDGRDYWVRGRFREVSAPERLVIDCQAHDEAGKPALEEVIEVTFEERAGRTTLSLNTTAVARSDKAPPMLKGMQQGWNQTIERLGSHVGNNPEKGTPMQLQPYLVFEGRCEEAIELYKKVLGAKVEMLMRFKEAPEGPPPAPANRDKIMHASLKIGEATVMASDGRMQGKPAFQGFALSLDLKTRQEAERVFNALAEGGQVQMPLGKTFFASAFGMLADRFGVSWMVIVRPEAGK